jgi:chemotaxis protein methyltransferase CheR
MQAQMSDEEWLALGDDQETYLKRFFQNHIGHRFSFSDTERGLVYLLEFCRENDFSSVIDLIVQLHRGSAKTAMQLLSFFANSQTSFFRDPEVFSYVQNALIGELMNVSHERKSLTIWSAGCASGEEAFSLAVLFLERKLDMGSWQVRVFGTDFQDDLISKARMGVFPDASFSIEKAQAFQKKYCKPLPHDEWRLDSDLRKEVTFKTLNLLDSYEEIPSCDLISCRYVLNSMTPRIRMACLEKMAQKLNPQGYLLLGQTESVLGVSSDFIPVEGCRGLYMKK